METAERSRSCEHRPQETGLERSTSSSSGARSGAAAKIWKMPDDVPEPSKSVSPCAVIFIEFPERSRSVSGRRGKAPGSHGKRRIALAPTNPSPPPSAFDASTSQSTLIKCACGNDCPNVKPIPNACHGARQLGIPQGKRSWWAIPDGRETAANAGWKPSPHLRHANPMDVRRRPYLCVYSMA